MATFLQKIAICAHLLELVVVNGDTECGNAYQCSGDTIIEKGQDDGTLECSGSWSCLRSNVTNIELNGTSTDRETVCSGLRSCQEVTSLAVINRISGTDMNAAIDGYLGLAWGANIRIVDANSDTSDDSTGILACAAEAACVGISLVSEADVITCGGLRSCNDIEEAYVGYLNAYGSFDLMNSVFYSNPSNDSDTVYVFLDGFFSGYNGTFYCEAGDSCYVDCGINGCVGFNYYCDDSASCLCNCDDDELKCPNGWEDGSYTGDFSNNIGRSQLDMYFNISSNEIIENAFEKEYSSDPDYEINNECDTSCNNETDCFFDTSINVSSNSYCCNGAESCGSSDVTSSGSGDVYCNGGGSCSLTDFDLNGEGGSNIYVRCSRGVFGDYYNFNRIESSGSRGTTSAYMMGGDAVYCFGHSGCTFDNIYNVSKIYALGYFSLLAADIFSNGTDIDIYLLGFWSGSSLNVVCQGTDICTIYALNDDFGFVSTSNVNCDASNACTINYVVINGDATTTTPTTTDSGDSDMTTIDTNGNNSSPAQMLSVKLSNVWFMMVLVFLLLH